MASTLAALHGVVPAEVGLQGYGKASGYNRRQVWRWGQQYRQSVVQVSHNPWVAGWAVAEESGEVKGSWGS